MCGRAKPSAFGNSPSCSTCACGSRGFSATAWFLSHISRMERQSYYTMESGLHGTAASVFRLGGPGYSLDRPVAKPGVWFMGQFRMGRDSVLIHLPLLLALMGYPQRPYSEQLNGCTEINFSLLGRLPRSMRGKRAKATHTCMWNTDAQQYQSTQWYVLNPLPTNIFNIHRLNTLM